MFFVHLSISNLYSSLVQVHEDMQDAMIINLASDIKKITETFGPPPPESPTVLNFLIGAFVGAAALAGPIWTLAAPATSVVGGLNMAAGASQQEDTRLDFENDLEKSLGDFYRKYGDTLEDTVNSIFGGDFGDLENIEDAVNPLFGGNLGQFDMDQYAIEFILNQFGDGKMLDHTLVDPIIDKWIDTGVDLIRQGLVIQSMIKEEHYIWRDFSKTEEECGKGALPNQVWVDDMCTSIAKTTGGGSTSPYPIDDDLYDPMTGDYGIDYEECLRNAVECTKTQGGEADLTELPPFNEVPAMPPCFCNFVVREMDFNMNSRDDSYR